MDSQKIAPYNFKIISTDIQTTNEQYSPSIDSARDEPQVQGDSEDEGDMDTFIEDKKKQQSDDEGEEGDVDDSDDIPYTAKKVISIDELRLKKSDNVILVLGSEGEGVSKTINKLADHRVMIPPQLNTEYLGKYPFNMVDSLNVGVSAGLLIYHIRHLTKKN